MASRAEQKAAARAERMSKQRELKAAHEKRQRLMLLGGMLLALIVVAVVVVVANSGGKGKSPVKASPGAKAAALAAVKAAIGGIPQSGTTLGNPNAPITLIEYGDLVCPVCAEFAQTTEPQIIAALVKNGKAKLEWRGWETASGTANNSTYTTGQVAVRAAGLQNKAWDYILLNYEEQPSTIGGTPAEEVAYYNLPYMQSIASQIKGLKVSKWQASLTDTSLANLVTQDGTAANSSGATGTPAIVVVGPKGSQLDSADQGVPQLSTIESLVSQVS